MSLLWGTGLLAKSCPRRLPLRLLERYLKTAKMFAGVLQSWMSLKNGDVLVPSWIHKKRAYTKSIEPHYCMRKGMSTLEDKVYATLAATRIASAMGAVVENWSVDRIEKTHGVFRELAEYRTLWQRRDAHPEQPKMGSNGRSSCARRSSKAGRINAGILSIRGLKFWTPRDCPRLAKATIVSSSKWPKQDCCVRH